jgi:hypothetical protein
MPVFCPQHNVAGLMLTNFHSSHCNLIFQPLALRSHAKPKRTKHHDADHAKRPGCNPDFSIAKQFHQNHAEKQAHPRDHRDNFKLLNRLKTHVKSHFTKLHAKPAAITNRLAAIEIMIHLM